jgi:hypothetical protein
LNVTLAGAALPVCGATAHRVAVELRAAAGLSPLISPTTAGWIAVAAMRYAIPVVTPVSACICGPLSALTPFVLHPTAAQGHSPVPRRTGSAPGGTVVRGRDSEKECSPRRTEAGEILPTPREKTPDRFRPGVLATCFKTASGADLRYTVFNLATKLVAGNHGRRDCRPLSGAIGEPQPSGGCGRRPPCP